MPPAFVDLAHVRQVLARKKSRLILLFRTSSSCIRSSLEGGIVCRDRKTEARLADARNQTESGITIALGTKLCTKSYGTALVKPRIGIVTAFAKY